MPNLTIRNLTTKRLELVSAQRFPAQHVRTVGLLYRLGHAVSDFLNATHTCSSELRVRPGAEATDRRDGVALRIEPFGSVETDLAAPEDHDGGHGRDSCIVRLTFTCDDGDGYETDVPSPSSRFAVMRKTRKKKLGGGEEGEGDGAKDEDDGLAVVYVPSSALVAVYPCVALDGWMADVPDGWPLPSLSIPGTHNSPTCRRALPSVRCQAVSVAEQLRHGVRFLDVRVSVAASPPPQIDSGDKDKTAAADAERGRRLALVHGVFPVALTGTKYLAALLDDLYAFLDRHPSETVILSLKREGTGKGTDGDLARYLRRAFVYTRPERWFTAPRVPSLGECRGRIVLLRRFGLDGGGGGGGGEEDGGWGLDASRWPDNCDDGDAGSCAIRVQDYYDVGARSVIDKKVDFSHGHLERAGAARHVCHLDGETTEMAAAAPPFFVNFLSASNFFRATCWPERVAARVNPRVVEYLCARHGVKGKGPNGLDVGHAGVGIVVTDWVGADGDWDLVRCVVGMNARLQRRQHS